MSMTLEQNVLNKIIRTLTNLKVDFVIDLGDGELASPEYTKIKAGKRPKRDGQRSAYIDEYLELMEPGDKIRVPFDKYSKDEIGGLVSSRANVHFGKGNYATRITEDGVWVLCLDTIKDQEQEQEDDDDV